MSTPVRILSVAMQTAHVAQSLRLGSYSVAGVQAVECVEKALAMDHPSCEPEYVEQARYHGTQDAG